MSLKAAHSGYLYQDIATAYMLVLALADSYDKVIVDKKQVDDDRIDDLEIIIDGKRIRRQFKSSQNTARTIEESDFTGPDSSLRIDRLVLTQKQETGATYRLCATWAPPLADSALCGLIEKASAETTFKDAPNSIYRVIPEKVWPHGQQAIWQPLQASKSITKQDFYDFCHNFLIELELPPASTELNQPGALEKSLFSLLQSRIGIGRYPNHTRRVEDVAALAISLATFARTKEAELTSEQIQAELNIRLDYGYISQTFPIDYSTYLSRKDADDKLKNLASSGGRFILLGAPGSGKSWTLTALAEDLKKNGVIVARHYCFIAPDDQNASLRITTNQFYGNLIAELVKAHSDVARTLNTYAAGLTELEKAINSLTEKGNHVVIIVDGLDHIERVLKNTPNVSPNEAGIIEQLSILSLKNELCTIIIGTQPGEHLSILENSCDKGIYCNIDPWSQEDFFNLSIKYDLKNKFLISSDNTEDSYNRVLKELYTKSEGNPLYINYILRSIVFSFQQESTTDIFEWAKRIPPFAGHINSYYSYLYEGVSDLGKFFAELLAVIDFSVSKQDIEEISPHLQGWTEKIIATLSPVLTITTGQGGIRVFHESFKRFILESLLREGRSSEQALSSVANWLLVKGFFRDARAFRFLFPVYYHLNKHVEICKLASPDYVALSVAYIHPVNSILNNITIAAKAAAAQNDWPALVRCVELNRALETYDAERRSQSFIFYQAHLATYGTSLLTERLLFEGNPALPRRPWPHAL